MRYADVLSTEVVLPATPLPEMNWLLNREASFAVEIKNEVLWVAHCFFMRAQIGCQTILEWIPKI
jgi:hypothetical protein